MSRTTQNLINRINTQLAKEDQRLRKCREGSRWHNELGDYFTVCISTNGVIDTHVCIESMARELGGQTNKDGLRLV